VISLVRQNREGTMKLPHRRQFLHLVAGAAALPAISLIAGAQSRPTRPITIIVPYAPGGAGDLAVRVLSEAHHARTAGFATLSLPPRALILLRR
jgi:hypothetical protein